MFILSVGTISTTKQPTNYIYDKKHNDPFHKRKLIVQTKTPTHKHTFYNRHAII